MSALGYSSYPKLSFSNSDFMEGDWASNADLVFANATCFDKELVTKVEKLLEERLKAGAVLILSSQALENGKGKFELLGSH
mmetsp:Transcript_16756/g.11972  ORF Transcript_16756/g.11972 Transcript_16756/m.11972 type:complete len:81 (+) Transcript_16756:413-655(+)